MDLSISEIKAQVETQAQIVNERFARDMARLKSLEDTVTELTKIAAVQAQISATQQETIGDHEKRLRTVERAIISEERIEELAKRIKELESKPNRWLDKLMSAVISAIVSGVIAAVVFYLQKGG